MQNPEIRNKWKNTVIQKYGTTNFQSIPEIKEKIIKKSLEKYGVENPMQSEEIKAKRRKTCLEKYGVENAMQSDETNKKRMASILKNPNGFGKAWSPYKQLILESGKVIKYQGYEDLALLNYLLPKYNEDDIINDLSELYKFKFSYFDNNSKKHYYIPDFFIKSKNMFYEVKSSYTLKLHYDSTLLKMKSVLDKNYNIIILLVKKLSKTKAIINEITYEELNNKDFIKNKYSILL